MDEKQDRADSEVTQKNQASEGRGRSLKQACTLEHTKTALKGRFCMHGCGADGRRPFISCSAIPLSRRQGMQVNRRLLGLWYNRLRKPRSPKLLSTSSGG